MKNLLSEKEYQHFIMNYLKDHNGYVIRPSDAFDRFHAMDIEMLMTFLWKTQPKAMETLTQIYKEDLEETLINFITNEVTGKKGSLLNLLKHGAYLGNVKLNFMYTKPATRFNKDLVERYERNTLSVMEEVWANEKERIDLVIFLNGFAIMSFELKCNTAGQSYSDAIKQYRLDRTPKLPLFAFKSGCLVNFAMDLQEVYMTTKLNGKRTFFLPFNKGNGEGMDAGKGNSTETGVSYMWEDILTKDSIIELINDFIFIEKKVKVDENTGKRKIKETLIFPRYHQRDAVHKILADVKMNGTLQNYLIQHSAGSGKTNSIAWLAYRLVTLHDNNNDVIFDNIIIITDRIIVDRQLQDAINGMDHVEGLVKTLGDNCTSADLTRYLKSNTKIIVTTIQKFPYIVNEVKSLNKKKFAVIIDEAHSSTSGKDMAAVSKALGSGDEVDYEDVISQEMAQHGKQGNVSMFAFTATPKPFTLQLFGKVNKQGMREAFHIYSMKQAIEEGFILDVLQNYTTYDTYYQISKEIQNDPMYETKRAKREIARFATLHHTNISQRIEVIVEHFRANVMDELNGTAKAMVVTSSREEAVKYRKELENYINKKGYTDIKALIAFSGKLTVDGQEYSEAKINGFSEDKLANEFNKDEYRVLLVANKYQTGFDQPRLCAMYILKKLRGVNAVQTLSRLNRICPPHDKKTFILDFVNDYDDIVEAFSKYYTVTILSDNISEQDMRDAEIQLDSYYIIEDDDIEKATELLVKENATQSDKSKLTRILRRVSKTFDGYDEETQKAFLKDAGHFVKLYEFLTQVISFGNERLHKKYMFVVAVIKYLHIGGSGGGFSLDGKIGAINFVQKKTGEHKKSKIESDPMTYLPTGENLGLSDDEEKKLSEIIDEINNRLSEPFDNDVAVKSVLQIKDLLIKSDSLGVAAKNNTERDFEYVYYEAIDKALIEGLNLNRNFFGLLLNKPEVKKEVLGVFAKEIYNTLRDNV